MSRVSVQDWEFDYDDVGTGPPVVLMHGLLMDREMWDHQVESLRDDYRVVTIDAPGHGGSPARPPGFSVWDEAAALAGFADAIDLGPAVWGGQSMGGFKALRLALAEPSRVRGLILIDTSPGPENEIMKPQYEAFLTVALSDGVSEDLASVVGMVLFGEGFLATPPGEPWRKKLEGMDPHAVEGTCRLVFDRDDVTARLGEITAPSIVIHGVDDVAIPIDVGRRTAELLQTELVEVPAAGHASPAENPEVVTKAIRAFLDGLPR
jgi:3-oxoadipate enol-lactonase